MKTIGLVLGTAGGLACAVLGLQWMADASRQRDYQAVTALLGQDPDRLQLAAYLLLAALVAGVMGGVLAHNNRGHAAAAVLLIGGIAPGVVDPRAFVVTCVLILAGILSLELRTETCVRVLGRGRPSQSLG